MRFGPLRIESSLSKCFASSGELLSQRISEVKGLLSHFRGELVEWKKEIEGLMGCIEGIGESSVFSPLLSLGDEGVPFEGDDCDEGMRERSFLSKRSGGLLFIAY